jgi:hypothetical protein
MEGIIYRVGDSYILDIYFARGTAESSHSHILCYIRRALLVARANSSLDHHYQSLGHSHGAGPGAYLSLDSKMTAHLTSGVTMSFRMCSIDHSFALILH